MNNYSIAFVFCLFLLIGPSATSATETQIDWTRQADQLRGRNGQSFSYYCSAGGQASGRLWGTGLYTDDSSICTAAVHAGLITLDSGGNVTIEIRSGATSYQGSRKNGLSSNSYGSWHGSFAFVSGGAPAKSGPAKKGSDSLAVKGTSSNRAVSANWGTQADPHRGKNGQRFYYDCPAGGAPSDRLWGSDIYTDDSSICTAAVHSGLLNLSDGGKVAIEIKPGELSYRGSTNNGVASKGYGGWHGSFIFITE